MNAAKGRYTAKPLLFPDAHAFGDIFLDDFQDGANADPLWSSPDVPSFKITNGIGVRMSRFYYYGTVTPRAKVIDALAKVMLHVERCHARFQVIERDDGLCLVTCEYGVIIGNRYVALVNRGTLPKVLLDQESAP